MEVPPDPLDGFAATVHPRGDEPATRSRVGRAERSQSAHTVTVDARLLNRSGIGTYLQQLLPRLVRLNPDIRFVLLLDSRDDPYPEISSAGNVEVVGIRSRLYSLSEQASLLAAIPRGTDLFWAPHYVIPLLYRGRMLVTVHDLCHLALPELFGGPHRHLYAKAMFQAVRRRARRILVVSDFTRQEFLRLVGAPRGELDVVRNGVDDAWFSATSDRATPSAEPYFLYVGNVKPHKNLGTLLEAFRKVAGEIPHRLLLVGTSEGLLTADASAIRAAGLLGDRVRLTGHLDDGDLRACVAGAAALVFPTLYEGFGLPPLEAMAAGCPVIVSNAASLPEVCGSAARYFDPTDVGQLAAELMRIATEAPAEDELERGRLHARACSWDTAAELTGKAIRAALRP